MAEEEHVDLFTTPQTKMGAATSDFGYNLFRSLASQEAGNVFLAPISVSAVLTQLSMGDDTNAHIQIMESIQLFRKSGICISLKAKLMVETKEFLSGLNLLADGCSTRRQEQNRQHLPKSDQSVVMPFQEDLSKLRDSCSEL